jgi:hypothetical protein
MCFLPWLWLRIMVTSVGVKVRDMGDTLQPGDSLRANESITSPNGRYTFIYQSNGNLVLYSPVMPPWDSGTWGRPAGVCIKQHDGNLVIYNNAYETHLEMICHN